MGNTTRWGCLTLGQSLHRLIAADGQFSRQQWLKIGTLLDPKMLSKVFAIRLFCFKISTKIPQCRLICSFSCTPSAALPNPEMSLGHGLFSPNCIHFYTRINTKFRLLRFNEVKNAIRKPTLQIFEKSTGAILRNYPLPPLQPWPFYETIPCHLYRWPADLIWPMVKPSIFRADWPLGGVFRFARLFPLIWKENPCRGG